MERVKKFLRKSETVTEAIYETGFGSSSRLCERVDAQLGLTPAKYKAEGRGMEISYVNLSAPLGQILIAATNRGLCGLQLGDQDAELREVLRLWQETICGFVEGRKIEAGMPLNIPATAFQATVWKYLIQIPEGDTRAYTEVAAV